MACKSATKKPDPPAMNIQAYIRIRPLTPKEKRSPNLEFGKKDVTFKSREEPSRNIKKLTFDRVFEENSRQVIVYNTVVRPMIKDVLQGYNGTIFAYGQTGTGKTYTMLGQQSDTPPSLDDNVHAGIIPRALEDIFKEIKGLGCEYQVSVSYIELYNEKLRSLLQDNREETNIQLIDDLEGGVILKGLLPTPVKNRDEAFKLLQQGTLKRQTAATAINENSSRSHTIFSINVNIKENGFGEKDDLLRIGKLHLVDLAGSENVSKSGASDQSNRTGSGVNMRLAEASNINKSLLTLGRVITSITENSPHIPYRESKLTRFLRDSLGGRTKTCIIGTVSPAQANLDETESTLNYAYKARSIKNKPEKNSKISKKEFMQIASEEIMKLKRDLEAVRDGDGFYISKETHEEMSLRLRDLTNEVKEWNERFTRLNAQHDETKELFSQLETELDEKKAEYEEMENVYQMNCNKLNERLKDLQQEVEVREYFIKQYEKTESALTDQAKSCKSVIQFLLEQSGQLHEKIDRKKAVEFKNVEKLEDFKKTADQKINEFYKKVSGFYDAEHEFTTGAAQFTRTTVDTLNEENLKIRQEIEKFVQLLTRANEQYINAQKVMVNDVDDRLSDMDSAVREIGDKEKKVFEMLISDVIEPCSEIISQHVNKIKTYVDKGLGLSKMCEDTHKNLSTLKEASLKKVDCSYNCILSEFGIVEDSVQQRQLEVASTKKSASAAVQKADALLQLAIELKEQCKKNEEKAEESELNIAKVVKDVDHFKTFIVRELDEYKVENNKLIKQIFDRQESFINEYSNIVHGLRDGTNLMSDASNTVVNELKSTIAQRMDTVHSYHQMEQENVTQTRQVMRQHAKTVESKALEYQSATEEQLLKTNLMVKELESKVENLLRDHHMSLHNHLTYLSIHKKTTGTQVSDLTSNILEIQYSPDVSLGITPRRVNQDELEYPREFQSTAARSVLAERFKETLEAVGHSVDNCNGGYPVEESDRNHYLQPTSELDDNTDSENGSLKSVESLHILSTPKKSDEDKENSAVKIKKKHMRTVGPALSELSINHIAQSPCQIVKQF